MEASISAPTRTCVSCGRAISFEANVCPYCGHDYRMPVYAGAAAPAKKSSLPTIGGVLIVLAGILAIIMGVFYLALDANDILGGDVVLPPEMTEEDIQNIMVVCGSLCLIFGIVAVVGGIFAIQRKYLALGVIGGIFGLLGLGFGFGSLLALIGLILLVVGRKDFD